MKKKPKTIENVINRKMNAWNLSKFFRHGSFEIITWPSIALVQIKIICLISEINKYPPRNYRYMNMWYILPRKSPFLWTASLDTFKKNFLFLCTKKLLSCHRVKLYIFFVSGALLVVFDLLYKCIPYNMKTEIYLEF